VGSGVAEDARPPRSGDVARRYPGRAEVGPDPPAGTSGAIAPICRIGMEIHEPSRSDGREDIGAGFVGKSP